MNKEKQITSLDKFPTEALVMNYRRHRKCYTRHYGTVECVFNHHTNQYEYWEEFTGPFEIDGVVYNPCVIGYTKITKEEFHKKYTEIKAISGHVANMAMTSDGPMKWSSFLRECTGEEKLMNSKKS